MQLSKTDKDKLLSLGLKKIEGTITLTWKEIGQLFNMSGEDARQLVKSHRYSNKEVKGKYEKGRLKFLIFSDLHVPDHDEEYILDIVTKHKHVDVIILAGDIIDCAAVSSFDNEGISILDKELVTAHWLLKKMREISKAKIVLIKGNHEQRVNRHYAKNAKTLGTALVETEILHKLATGFEVKIGEVNEKVEYKKISNVDYVNARTFMYGDLLIGHPSTFSKIPMKTVTNMYEGRYRVKYPNAKVIIIGHTHQVGIVYRDDGVVLVEDGCSCFNMSYAEQDDKPYGNQQRGYVYLEMKDKKVDMETLKLQHMGVARNRYDIKRYELNNDEEDDISSEYFDGEDEMLDKKL